MKVFTDEFVNAVKGKLETLPDGDYLTREKLCIAINVPAVYANAISMLMAQPEFSGFEAVKSRGIRRKKIQPIAAE